MDSSLILQKQIRDNSEDLQNYLRDLKHWELEMKRKDASLAGYQGDNEPIPAVRRKLIKKADKKISNKKEAFKPKRIPSADYKSWEKFDVDKVLEEMDKDTNNAESEEEEEDQLELKRLHQQAAYEKECGNRFVKQAKWDLAIEAYTRAIQCNANNPIFYANRALCYLKQNNWRAVDADCSSALHLDPTYVKAYQRRAAARLSLSQYQEARQDLMKVLQFEPNNVASRSELAKVEQKLSAHQKNIIKSESDQGKLKTTAVGSDEKIIEKPKVVQIKSKLLVEDKKKSLEIKPETLMDMRPSSVLKTEKCHDFSPWGITEVPANLVLPVRKPPHLRSKKPLKRITIQEIDNKSEKKNNKEVSEVTGEKSASEHRVTKSPASEPMVTSPTARLPMATLTREMVSEIVGGGDGNMSSVPKTSVQFLRHWKALKGNTHQCYLYLNKIDGYSLPSIFRDSLESDLFSEIVDTLASKFIPSGDKVYSYLQGLSRVGRFSALTLFMSTTDKQGIMKLIDHCRTLEECSEDNLILLKKKYEV